MAVKARTEVTLSCIVDIEAVYRYYLLQSSTLDAPPVPTVFPPTCRENCKTCTNSSHYKWDDTEPTFNKTTTSSLYTVECTLFCDGTWEYTSVSLSSSYEAAKEAYQEALNAKKVATNYMDFAGDYGDGLVIGDLTASILGRNAYIDSEGFYIRNGTDVLASFNENSIHLGNNAPNATIYLCGEQAIIRQITEDNTNRLSIEASKQLKLSSENGVYSVTKKTSGSLTGTSILSLQPKALGSSNVGGHFQLYSKVENASAGTIDNATVTGDAGYVWLSGLKQSDNSSAQIFINYEPNKIQMYGDVYMDASLEVAETLKVTGAATLSGTLRVSGVSTMGRINASNVYLSGSLYVGGKSSTSDGKPGVAFGASGNITMQSTSTAKINFINGTNTSAKAYIASGSSNDISLVGNGYVALLTSTNGVSLKPDTVNTAYDSYFYPHNDAKCTLGTTANRWYRLYQSQASVYTSDKRQKENIKALKNVKKNRKKADGTTGEFDVYAELFDRLEPVEYNFIEGENRKNFGLIAQDVLEVMAELGLAENELDLVHHDTWIDEETGEERDGYGIAYENLIAVLIHEVQKLKATVKYK